MSFSSPFQKISHSNSIEKYIFCQYILKYYLFFQPIPDPISHNVLAVTDVFAPDKKTKHFCERKKYGGEKPRKER
jgi:hypothetical protein